MMPSVKEPDLAVAGLALLVIFGLLIWYDRPVESARPFDPYAQHQDLQTTGYAYESWLWQDPFAFDSINQKKESEFYSVDQKKEFEFYFINQKKKPQGQCEYQLNNKINDIKDREKNDVRILAPLLKVRPDTVDIENKELRTRDRYAVIAGLIESGYRPLEPDHLHFCSTQKNKEYDVRWEHFSYEPKYQSGTDTSRKNKTDRPGNDESANKPDIIVIWMNSEIFTDDDKFHLMSESLFKSKEISRINFLIYDLNNILDPKRTSEIAEKINEINKNKKIELKRTGTDDKALTEKLTEELKERRNIKESSEVIIITEQESENARSLANNFCKSLSGSFAKDKPNASSENSTCEIRNVFYLKGLDAYQQILHKQDKNEEQANKTTARLSAIDLHIPPPPPIGPSQFDYFHRLAKQINDVHKEINLEKRDSGVRAVGIFGSDFYDKLLILEALRAEMPNILVFTTGLDAQMLHPSHWLSTRNLVVASHFELNEEYQKHFPAFRDSQQASIFYCTMNIINDVKKPEISPQVFEIGRNGPVRLTRDKNEVLNSHSPDNTLKQAEIRLILLGGIMLILICFYGLIIRPNSRILSIYLFLNTLVIFAIAWFFAISESGEPFSFTEGVSLWPTIFIQIIAIFLASAFIWRAICELNKNFIELNVHPPFFKIDPKEHEPCLSKPWPLSRGGKLTLSVIILILTIAVYAINDAYPSSFLRFWPCLILLVVPAILFLLTIKIKKDKDNFNFDSIKHWIEKENPRRILRRLCVFSSSRSRVDQENYENSVWQEYYNYGRLDHRINRVVAIWLFFAIVETILIYLLPPWPWPCRGPTCHWVYWIGVMSFIVIMILLFFILDAVKLSFYWIRKLRTQHPLLDKKNGEKNLIASDNPLELLENIVAIVAERTRVVDNFIYYPMLCIMLMLFAKITYFDNQDFPLSKGITFAASISLLFFSGFMLRDEAKKLKRSVIESAEILGKNKICIQAEVDRAIKRINDICEGAFQPMMEQPVLRALLIILASVGVFAGEYLNLFG